MGLLQALNSLLVSGTVSLAACLVRGTPFLVPEVLVTMLLETWYMGRYLEF